MKKFLCLLLISPLLFASCSDDDDDFPNVKVKIETTGATIVDGVIYVVQGDLFSIDDITVVTSDANSQVVIGSASFYWDRMFVGSTTIAPFNFIIDTYTEAVGRHLLQVRCSLLAVDYSPVVGVIKCPVKIVASADDVPQGSESTQMLVYPVIDD